MNVLILLLVVAVNGKNLGFQYKTNLQSTTNISVDYMNKEYLKEANINLVYSKESWGMYISGVKLIIHTLQPITKDLWFKFELYQFRNGEFHAVVPLNFKVSMDELVEKNIYGIGAGIRRTFGDELPIAPKRFVMFFDSDPSKFIELPYDGPYHIMGHAIKNKEVALSISWYGEKGVNATVISI